MVGIKLLLLSSLFFFQGIYAFCIYNMFTDGSSFKIVQGKSCAPSGEIFHKHMEMHSMVCCPYTEKDCSCNLKNDDEVLFYVFFYFASGYPSVQSVKCTTGGGLVIYGTQEKYSAGCVDANGVYKEVPVEDVAVKPSYYY